MKLISLTACLCLLLFSCRQSGSMDVMSGLWKIRKVEILKGAELQKIIDTGYQYWSFQKPSIIEIYDTHKVQNILHIKMGMSSIRSYDNKGALQDEFQITELDKDAFSLTSKKKVEDAEYNIVYYLDKVKDSTGDILEAH